MRYWVRLLPLPGALAPALERGLERTGLARRAVTLPVGNQLAWAVKG